MTQTGQKRDGRNRKISVKTEFFHLKYVHIIIKIQKNTNRWLLTCMGSQVRVLYYPPYKNLETAMVSGFFFIPKTVFSLIFSLTAQKTRTSAGTGPLKSKIVFMLCYQYSRIERENQSQGFTLPVDFECTVPFGRRWPSSSDLSHVRTRPR